MTRRLSDHQVHVLFFGHLSKTKDLEAAIELVYEAGRSSGEKAVARLRRRRQERTRGSVNEMGIAAVRARAAGVLSAVAGRHRMTVEAMLVGRSPVIAGPRFEAMWILRQRGMSFPDIAIATHHANHTTAINGVRKVEARIAAEPGLRDELLGLVAPAVQQLRSVA